MNAFEIVTIAVSVVAIAVAATTYFRVSRALSELGRQGRDWFENPQEREIEELPSEDEPDDPIPRRPLRGWPH